MASHEGDGARVINKFNGKKFNLWKFKLDMRLAYVNLWNIVDAFEEASPSNTDPKVKKKNMKDVSRKQCLSLCSTWQTINLRTLGLQMTNESMEDPL